MLFSMSLFGYICKACFISYHIPDPGPTILNPGGFWSSDSECGFPPCSWPWCVCVSMQQGSGSGIWILVFYWSSDIGFRKTSPDAVVVCMLCICLPICRPKKSYDHPVRFSVYSLTSAEASLALVYRFSKLFTLDMTEICNAELCRHRYNLPFW